MAIITRGSGITLLFLLLELLIQPRLVIPESLMTMLFWVQPSLSLKNGNYVELNLSHVIPHFQPHFHSDDCLGETRECGFTAFFVIPDSVGNFHYLLNLEFWPTQNKDLYVILRRFAFWLTFEQGDDSSEGFLRNGHICIFFFVNCVWADKRPHSLEHLVGWAVADRPSESTRYEKDVLEWSLTL